MANPNQVVGQATIKVDGDTLETKAGATLELGGPVRTAQRGDYQAGAFSEETVESKLTCTLLVKRNTRITNLREIDNATVTFNADTGQVFIMRQAYCADNISLAAAGEGASVVFQGPPAQEL
ncbi:phage tail tube protein [Sphingopyxis sp. GW247-27LB]|uniref:phage tail tube protein n=1 Tax=Sphingopyxis sp. GW247-27LB TaxID=2012632 RepID=UPI000BA6822E|nr:phage tail tube protein [Sphingopyxis sp. GW247-27LB]PAL25474.1 phage tail protein [Sphingopyxis sp. GW247-27LB]